MRRNSLPRVFGGDSGVERSVALTECRLQPQSCESQIERVSQNFPTNNSYRQSAKMCNFIKDWGTDRRSIGGMGREGGECHASGREQKSHSTLEIHSGHQVTAQSKQKDASSKQNNRTKEKVS